MCGLAGFWEFKPSNESGLHETVSAMCAVINFRGPDSHGSWVSDNDGFAIGHNRLAIVDLSPAGAQPMISSNGRYVLAYNGEIYNATELRQELKQQGAKFRGHSDTEVLLEACMTWGVEQAATRCNGMFAFALWDQLEKRLFLVRDRLGIKPLYWGFNQGVLFFGSQSKPFTKHPIWQGEINSQALAGYFYHNYLPNQQSIYQDIQQVEPGSIVCIDADKATRTSRFWSLDNVIQDAQDFSAYSLTELEDTLDSLLRDAVKRRMVADVPLGAFLSGGIDSSTVVALMQAQSTRPIKTFSIGFSDQAYNEAPYAKAIADYLGTDHEELYLEAQDAFNLIPSLPNWYDEPFADSSQIPTYLVSKMARNQVTVSLSGDGGDELFGGYNRYILTQKIWSILRYIPFTLRRVVGKNLSSWQPATVEKLVRFIPDKSKPTLLVNKFYKLASILGQNRHQFYSTLVGMWPENEMLVAGVPYHYQMPLPKNNLDYISEMQYADTLQYLPDDILTKVDRASMAVSLEARVPLLDYRVVAFAWSLSSHQKIANGQSKYLLRKVLNRYVPSSLIDRPKMGFGIPLGEWLRGPLRDWAEHLLQERILNADGLLNAKPIRKRWEEHLLKKGNWEQSLWGVLMFLAWKEKCHSRGD